tara:strand:- start:1214 stop:1450 length:237 start_codon:yes stop_codon:yes gene_type:complete
MAKSEEINIKLSKDEALVLFEFVSRFNETEHKDLFQDQSEQKMMWLIEGQLQKILVEPFRPDYKEIIDNARNSIRTQK